MNDCPEMDFFMNEDKSDVVFMVEGKRVPALKIILCMKNRVFRDLFSDNFEESKDKTVVIEETTFEAFKTFILFLYSDRLVFEDENDVKLIEDVLLLSEKYDEIHMKRKTIKRLNKIEMTYDNFEQISRIAFRYEIEELISKLKTFIDNNFNNLIKSDIKELCELNYSTNGKLFEVNVSHFYIKVSEELFENKKYFKQGKCEDCRVIHFSYIMNFHWINRTRTFISFVSYVIERYRSKSIYE